MAPHIRPLYPEAKLTGYARTVHCVAVDAVLADPSDWYRGELEAVDSLRPGDVMPVAEAFRLYGVLKSSSGSPCGRSAAAQEREPAGRSDRDRPACDVPWP